ncbi:MAG: hypothetical protein R3C11_10115 [Planctomycetaceae bacterium]
MTSFLDKFRRHKVRTGFLGLVLVMLVYFIAWRTYRIHSIPDVGAPFDVEAYLAKYELAENQYQEIFVETFELSLEIDSDKLTSDGYSDFDRERTILLENFQAFSEFQSHFELLQPLLDRWKAVAEHTDGFLIHPYEYPGPEIEFSLSFVDDLNNLILLESANLIHKNELEKTWDLYRDYLLIQKQSRAGSFRNSYHAIEHFELFSDQFRIYLENSELTTDRLRQIHQEMNSIIETYPPLHEVFYYDYVRSWHAYTSKHQNFIDSASGKKELMRRSLNLFLNNWLAHCDEPQDVRPGHLIYEFESIPHELMMEYNPYAERRYAYSESYKRDQYAAELITAFDHLKNEEALASPLEFGLTAYEAKLRQQDQNNWLNQLHFALQIYQREKGVFPTNLEELVPGYLKELPPENRTTGRPIHYVSHGKTFELWFEDDYSDR